ncbi:hypothetical protein JOF59_006053 [Streptomyces clavifer]|uniref:Uncharacterized protein n=1 Tax=Streptomyces clavifer TaxID=68188 RepID=A0ABS4VI08_9ACTN|nr:hypothetical protein [Streptomyces clavifer]
MAPRRRASPLLQRGKVEPLRAPHHPLGIENRLDTELGRRPDELGKGPTQIGTPPGLEVRPRPGEHQDTEPVGLGLEQHGLRPGRR